MKLAWFSCDVSRELAWVAQALHPGEIQHMDQAIITLKDIELWSSTSEDHTLLNLAILPMKCVISPVSRALSAFCQELQQHDYSANQTTALSCQLSSPEEGHLTLLHQAVTWICHSILPLTRVTHQECQPVLPHRQEIMPPYTGIQRASQTVITWTYSILQLKYVLKPLKQSSSSSKHALAPSAPDILKPQGKDVSSLSQSYVFWSLQRVIGTIKSLQHTIIAHNQDVISAHSSIWPSCEANMSLIAIQKFQLSCQDKSTPCKTIVPLSFPVVVRNAFQTLLQSVSQQNHDTMSGTGSMQIQQTHETMSSLGHIRAYIRQSFSSKSHFKWVESVEHIQSRNHGLQSVRHNDIPLNYRKTVKHALQSLLQSLTRQDQDIMSPKLSIQPTQQRISSLNQIPIPLPHVLQPLYSTFASLNPFIVPTGVDIAQAVPQDEPISMYIKVLRNATQSLRNTVSPYAVDPGTSSLNMQSVSKAPSPSRYTMLLDYVCRSLNQVVSPYINNAASAKTAIQPTMPEVTALGHVMTPLRLIFQSLQRSFPPGMKSISSRPNLQEEPLNGYFMSLGHVYFSVKNVFQPLCQSLASNIPTMEPSYESRAQPVIQSVLPPPLCPTLWNRVTQVIVQGISPYMSNAVLSKHGSMVPTIENIESPRHNNIPLSFTVVARHAYQTHQTVSLLSHIHAYIRQSLSAKSHFESVQTMKHIQSRNHGLHTVCDNDETLSYSKTAKYAFQSLMQSLTSKDQDIVSPKLSIQPTQQRISSLNYISIPLACVLQPLCSTFTSLNPFVVSPGANIAQAVPQDEPIPMYIKVLRNATQSLRNTVSPNTVNPGSPSLNMQSVSKAPSPSRYTMLLDYVCQPLNQAVSSYINDAASAKTAIQPTMPEVPALCHIMTPLKLILQLLQSTLSPNSKSISPSPNVQEEPLNDHAMSLSYINISVKNVFQPLCQALASMILTMEPSYASRDQPVIQHVSPAPCLTLWNHIQLIGQGVSPYMSSLMSSSHDSLEKNQTNSKCIFDNIPKNHTTYLIHRTCSNLKDATESLARYMRQARLPYTLFTMPVRGVLQRFTFAVLAENIVVKPLTSCMQSVRQAVVASSSAVVQMSSDLLVLKDVLLQLRHTYKPVCRSISLSRHVVLPFSRTLLPLRRTLLPIHQIILELRHAILPLIDAITSLSKTTLILFHSLAPLRLALPYLCQTTLPVIHVTALLSQSVPAPVLLRTIQLLERINAQLKRVTIPLIATSILLSCNTIVAFTDHFVKPGSQVLNSLIHATMPWRDRYIALLIPVLLKLKHNIQPSDHTLHKLKELVQQMKTGSIVLLNKVDTILHNAPAPPQYVTRLHSHSAKRLHDIVLPTKRVIFCLNETALSLSKVIFELRHTIVPVIRAIPPMLDAFPTLVEVIPPASQALLPLGELIFPLGCGVCVLGHALLPMSSSLLPMATSSYGILLALPRTFKFAFLDKGSALCGILL